MRLIDADELMGVLADRLTKVSERYGVDSAVAGAVSGAMRLVDVQPTVKPERKTGRWIDLWDRYRCSACNLENSYEDNFCPNCGAKMDMKDGNGNG